MDPWILISGLFVGLIMGATGMGGGIIMTPLLLFVFGVPPAVAIGTDLIFASVTKSFGVLQHWRQRTIDFALLSRVILGSAPGTILGLLLLYMLNRDDQAALNLFITKSISVAFMVISIETQNNGANRHLFIRCNNVLFDTRIIVIKD